VNPVEEYFHERDERIKGYAKDRKVGLETFRILDTLVRIDYVKNFTWLGVPIMQQPSDMFVVQELISNIQPDYLIETGVAFGGSILFYATVMEGIEWGRVIGIDKEIRSHTRKALEYHSLEHRFHLIEGDSANPATLTKIYRTTNLTKGDKVVVILDSDHSHEHVLKELNLYSHLVSIDSYVIVFDTTIETMKVKGKNWGPGNNPMTAVREFMEGNKEFIIDREIEARAFITSAENGYLRRVK